jgi:ppGpp synthetase/RelA/SpoT-type nucleotidyltranferase
MNNASNYPDRSVDNNMVDIIGVRILHSQRVQLEKYAKLNKINTSIIVREAITMWLNMNAKG